MKANHINTTEILQSKKNNTSLDSGEIFINNANDLTFKKNCDSIEKYINKKNELVEDNLAEKLKNNKSFNNPSNVKVLDKNKIFNFHNDKRILNPNENFHKFCKIGNNTFQSKIINNNLINKPKRFFINS